MFLWFVKVIQHLATLFTVRFLPSPELRWIDCGFSVLIPVRLQVQHVTILATSHISRRGIWNTEATWDVTTTNQWPAGWYEAISCVSHGFIDYLNGLGWEDVWVCLWMWLRFQDVHTHTHTKIYDRNSAGKQYRTVTDGHAPRKSFLIKANLQPIVAADVLRTL